MKYKYRVTDSGVVEVLCCSDTPRPGVANDIVGCGLPVNMIDDRCSVIDDEGYIDCPKCGIFFNVDAADWKPLRKYHFSVGNSTSGPVGAAGIVWATAHAQAVDAVRGMVPDEIDLSRRIVEPDLIHVQYLNVYFNGMSIKPEEVVDSGPVGVGEISGVGVV